MNLKPAYLFLAILLTGCSFEDTGNQDETGSGGSMARFTLEGNHLYTVDATSLHTFDISQPTSIQPKSRQQMGYGIETIFSSDHKLYMGSNDGMYIYSLENPDKPEKMSYTPHFQSYDPVVVNGHYAYVTLRTDAEFWHNENLLQIYDIENPYNPSLVSSFPMDGPKGLGITDNFLFICDKFALKIFKLESPTHIDYSNPDFEYSIRANDIIIKDSLLHVVANDGLYNFHFNEKNLEMAGKITIPFISE